MSRARNDLPDHTGAWDYVVLSVIGVGCLVSLAGNVILIRNRACPPVQTRGVFLTTLSTLGGFVWIGSTLVVLRHFPRQEGSVFAVCSLWTFWLWACFGFALWVNCLTVRMMQLYIVIQRKLRLTKPDLFRLTIAPLLALLSPTIIISACASGVKAVKYKEDRKDCNVDEKAFGVATICLLPIYFLILIWFAFKLRHTMSQWNEFRQIRIGAIMSFFLFLLSLVTLQSKVQYKVAGRCFLSSAVAGGVFYYFWARNWEVIYNVLVNKQQYVEQFGHELNKFTGRSSSLSHFEANPIEKLVWNIKEEVRQYEQRMLELQSEVTTLTQQNAHLHKEVMGA